MSVLSFSGTIVSPVKSETTSTGKTVNKFKVKVSDYYGGANHTNYVTVNTWGEDKRAAKYTEGSWVTVTGTVQFSTFLKKDGTAGFNIDVNPTEVTLLPPWYVNTSEKTGNNKPFPKATEDAASELFG